MPKYKVEILTPAWRDIDRISDFYLMKMGPQSAERITDQILDTIDLLEEHPYMGPLHPDPVLARNEYRKVICSNYICVYKVIDNTVFIYRVVDGRTDYPRLFY